MARRLSDRRTVIVPDMRNHGESPRFETQSYHDMAADLAALIKDPIDVVGHSMGGKAAMVLALTAPEKVNSLAVADIAPVAYGHTQLPLIRAMQALDLDRISNRREADNRLRSSIPEPEVRAFLLQSLDIPNKRWRLNLDVLAGQMDHIIGFPPTAGRFLKKTLFLSGGASDYVRPEHRSRIAELFPGAKHEVLEGAGHWLHAEDPKGFESSLRRFLG